MIARHIKGRSRVTKQSSVPRLAGQVPDGKGQLDLNSGWMLQEAAQQLQSGKVQALVAGHWAVHNHLLRRVSLLVHYEVPPGIEEYIAAASRAGPIAGSGTVLAILTVSQAALARPLAQLLQVCFGLTCGTCTGATSAAARAEHCGCPPIPTACQAQRCLRCRVVRQGSIQRCSGWQQRMSRRWQLCSRAARH